MWFEDVLVEMSGGIALVEQAGRLPETTTAKCSHSGSFKGIGTLVQDCIYPHIHRCTQEEKPRCHERKQYYTIKNEIYFQHHIIVCRARMSLVHKIS